MCPRGFWGPSCANLCHCIEVDACNSGSGECERGNCAIGYTDIPRCQTPCSNNTYGLNCAETCRCPPSDSCNAINGVCASGRCVLGYAGPGCQTRLPILIDPPEIRETGVFERNIIWAKFREGIDIGGGPVSQYVLQQQERTAATPWQDLIILPEDPNPQKTSYSHMVTNLQQGKEYSWRVVLWMVSDDARMRMEESVPGPNTPYDVVGLLTRTNTRRTTTTGPSFPGPKNLRLTGRTDTTLSIEWEDSVDVTTCCVNQIRLIQQRSPLPLPPFNFSLFSTYQSHFTFRELNPTTLYRIEVSSFDTGTWRESTRAAEEFWTIQDAIGTPPTPRVIKIVKQRVHVHVRPIVDSMRHVDFYDVVLEDIGSQGGRETLNRKLRGGTFTEDDLSDYAGHRFNDRETYIALRLRNIPLRGQTVVLGDGTDANGYQNGPLRTRGEYLLWLSAYTSIPPDYTDRTFKQARVKFYPGSGKIVSLREGGLSTGMIVLIVFLSLLLLVAIIVGVYICLNPHGFREKMDSVKRFGFKTTANNAADDAAAAFPKEKVQRMKPSKEKLRSLLRKRSNDMEYFAGESPRPDFNPGYVTMQQGDAGASPMAMEGKQRESRPVPIAQLAAVVEQKDSQPQTMAHEFNAVPHFADDSSVVARQPRNKQRNRFGRTIAFDKNRVKLEGQRNDYINASLVKSHTHGFYIVTQAPLASTVDDFWRMTWQKNVDTVVMLLALKEPPSVAADASEQDVDVDEPPADAEPSPSTQQRKKSRRPSRGGGAGTPVEGESEAGVEGVQSDGSRRASARRSFNNNNNINDNNDNSDNDRATPTNTSNNAETPARTSHSKTDMTPARSGDGDVIHTSANDTIEDIELHLAVDDVTSDATTILEADFNESNNANAAAGRDHYDAYWPEKDSGKRLFGDIFVETILETQTAFYTIRWIRIKDRNAEDDEERSVVHLQYTAWAANGVPHHPFPFLCFLQRVNDLHVASTNLLVHCQSGGGRSGLFVAVHSLLQQAQQTKQVDVPRAVSTLRRERPNMVRTMRQYFFIYDALLEALHYRDTRLAASKFQFTLDSLLSVSKGLTPTMLHSEYEALAANERTPALNKSFDWADYTDFHSPRKSQSFPPKLRPYSPSMAEPTDSGQCAAGFLVASLDSHMLQRNFRVTYYPTSVSSVQDFWAMVASEGCPCVVLLSDNSVAQTPYWPSNRQTLEYDNVRLRTVSSRSDRDDAKCVREIEVKTRGRFRRQSLPQQKTTQTVQHFTYNQWTHSKETPPLYSMLDFVNDVRRWYYGKDCVGPIAVQGTHGVQRAAFFCVLWTLIERCEEEEVVDIYRTVRFSRCSTPTAIPIFDQYKFLYRFVREHLRQTFSDTLSLEQQSLTNSTMQTSGLYPSTQPLLMASEETYSATLSDAAVAPPVVAQLRVAEQERSQSAQMPLRSTPGDVSHSAVRLVQSDQLQTPYDESTYTATYETYETAPSKATDDVADGMSATTLTNQTLATSAKYEYFSPKRSERDVTATPSVGTLSDGAGAMSKASSSLSATSTQSRARRRASKSPSQSRQSRSRSRASTRRQTPEVTQSPDPFANLFTDFDDLSRSFDVFRFFPGSRELERLPSTATPPASAAATPTRTPVPGSGSGSGCDVTLSRSRASRRSRAGGRTPNTRNDVDSPLD